MHTDPNKQLRSLAKAAVKELGDRLLRVIDSNDGEVYMEFRICSEVLSQKSEYFRNMLKSDMMESDPSACITIVVDSPRTFHSMIEYLYTDKVSLFAPRSFIYILHEHTLLIN